MKSCKSTLKNTAVVLFVLCVVISTVFLIGTSASAKSDNTEATLDSTAFCSACDGGDHMSLETAQDRFAIGENIEISYYADSEAYITDFDYSATGFTGVTFNIDKTDNKRISIEFSCTPNSTEYSADFEFELSSGETLHSDIYAIKNEYGVFISSSSEDDARERYFAYALDLGIMTESECDEIRAELSKRSLVPLTNEQRLAIINGRIGDISNNSNINSSNVNSTENLTDANMVNKVNGFLYWKDDSNKVHELRYVKVIIYYKTFEEPEDETEEPTVISEEIATVFADENGYFTYTLTESLQADNFSIKVYAGDNNVTVASGLLGTTPYYIIDNEATKAVSYSELYFTSIFNMSTDAGKAMQIGQAALTAREYAKAMMGRTPGGVTVAYPYFGNNCSYENILDIIFITNAIRYDDTYPHSYAAWDVIMHEYGHHIQYEVNIINSPGGDHDSSQNNADILEDKDKGTRLAWAEAWPTVFGTMAQDYFKDELTNIATVADTSYTSYNSANYSMEYVQIYLGDACERSIMAVLWDLYDDNEEAKDTIALSHSQYWAVTTGGQDKTFSDFIEYFYQQYPHFKDDIGKNLSWYGMASSEPEVLNISEVTQFTPPLIVWIPQGGSLRYPNNRFELKFYDSLGYEIEFETPITTTSSYYTLTEEQWSTVFDSTGTTYTIAIVAYQDSAPQTGGYYSEYVTYTKPLPISFSEDIHLSYNHRYTERVITLNPTQYIDYHITSDNSGYQLIQTFGDKSTRMELYSSSGVLLATGDYNGSNVSNCLISYYLEEDTEYIIRLRLFQYETAGATKLVITPATGLLDEYASEIGTFIDIKIITSQANCTLGVTLLPNQTAVFLYVPPSTDSYTIETLGNRDTYLYILEPNSSTAIDSSSYDDDDGEGLNASITKTLEGNKYYFVVVSLKDPSSISSNVNITVSITQN